jgi:hypothetical protein
VNKIPSNVILLTEDNEQDELPTIRALQINPIYNGVVFARDGAEAPENSYVRKPVDCNEFAQAAKTLGLYWLLLNKIAIPERST